MKSIILSAVFLLIIGCNNNAQKVNNNTQKTIPITDKYNLNSIIYKDVVLLKETLVKRFNYKEIVNKRKKTIRIISENTVNNTHLKYIVDFENPLVNQKGYNFKINDEFTIYKKSCFYVNQTGIDLTNRFFENNKTEKVFPSGVWHPSIDFNSVKYYKIKNKQLFLINGVNLYCNGNHCKSYQVYVIQVINNKTFFNAISIDGTASFNFENIKLFNVDTENNPKIFIPKSNLEVLSKKDLEIFTIKTTGFYRF